MPFLANATRPGDLDYQSGECDVNAAGTEMHCRFQQVFLTVSPLTASTCLITTNRYERIFQRGGPMLWTSRGAPQGDCGAVDVATLRGEGGIRWTLDFRTEITRPAANASCGAPATAETLSWQQLRRPLPCTLVEPGAILP